MSKDLYYYVVFARSPSDSYPIKALKTRESAGKFADTLGNRVVGEEDDIWIPDRRHTIVRFYDEITIDPLVCVDE